MFVADQGEIIFEHGEISKIISVTIQKNLQTETDQSFAVELYDPTGGALLGKDIRSVVRILNEDGQFFLTNGEKGTFLKCR